MQKMLYFCAFIASKGKLNIQAQPNANKYNII